MNKKFTIFIFIAFFLTNFSASSEDNSIKIISDNLNIDMEERKSIFKGNVYARNQNIKVWSDKMIIELKIKNDEIKEIIASGNVKIIRLNKGGEIYGDIANYLIEEEVIVVTGNVTVKESGNQISGNELVVDLKNSSSIMVGSDSNRVEALIIDN